MTDDSFASGSSTPLGSTPFGTPADAPGEVTSTLAELERKLRELEQELTSIGRRRPRPPAPQPPSAPPSSVPPSPSATTSASANSTHGSSEALGGRFVDEAATPAPPPAPPATHAPVFQSSPPDPAAVAAAASARRDPADVVAESARAAQTHVGGHVEPRAVVAEPRAIVAEPPTSFASEPGDYSERARPTEAQLASLAELRRFRDRLERFGRELVEDYDALLSRVMSGFGGRPAPAGSTPAASAPSTPAAAPSPATAPPPSQAAVSSSPPAGQAPPPAAVTPPLTTPAATSPAPPPGPSPPAAPSATQYEDALFEGNVELGVGPFYDIEALGAFERCVASLPYAIDVSVRRFEASHAVVDVRLTAPVALVRELRRVLVGDFTVRQVAGGRIALSFDD